MRCNCEYTYIRVREILNGSKCDIVTSVVELIESIERQQSSI